LLLLLLPLLQVVGCASLWIHGFGDDVAADVAHSSSSTIAAELAPVAQVGHLAVEPSFRTGGVGRGLLGYLERVVSHLCTTL
jgi:GNAT superfamily N-acetyltransferase